MNDLALSDDLVVIEREIYSFHELGSRSVWEIGKRLNHVKENDLTHGEFGEWLNKIGMNHNTANRYMKINKELNYDSSHNLGFQNLYHIALLPEEQKQEELQKAKEGNPSTVRELQEIKRKNAELEKQVEQAKRSEQIALKQLEEAENKEPEVIRETVEKEVIPANYKELESAERRLKSENRRLSEETETLKSRLQKLESNSAEVERLERTIDQLNEKKAEVNRILDANDKLSELEEEFHAFFDQKMAPLKYKPLVNELHSFNGSERMKELVNLTRSWVDDMDRMLPYQNRKHVEGEIING